MASLRWGIAGYGDVVCQRALPALAELGQQVTGIWGRHSGRAAAVALRYGAGRGVADFGELVAEADAVYVATPVAAHLPLAIAALEAGRHVLVEKPLGGGLSYDRDRLLAAAAGPAAGSASGPAAGPASGPSGPASGPSGPAGPACGPAAPASGPAARPASGPTVCPVVAAVAYYRRLAPAMLATRELMAGRGPYRLQASFRGVFAPAQADPMYWRTVAAVSGGGVLADAGSHRLDLLCWLLGRPVAAHAVLGDRFPGGAERTACLHLTWAEGSTARLRCAWVAEGPARDSLDCIGTGLEISLPVLDSGRMTCRIGGTRLHRDLPPEPNPLMPLLRDFLDCVETGRPPACPLADAILVDDLIRSAGEERR